MELRFRPFEDGDLKAMVRIWNEVVEAGEAFPQLETLTEETARAFFGEQTAAVVAEVNGIVFGLYILHPNNVGRCAHVANASYAVASGSRGLGLGRRMVEDSLERAAKLGFRGMQFNAVVASNAGAVHLYESIGFTRVGCIPKGFINGMGGYEDMYIYYKDTVPEAPAC